MEFFASFYDSLVWLIGVEENLADLSLLQIVARTVFVYGVALILIRIGKRRFLGGFSAFDILMGFVVGSIMSRTITGRETLFSATVVILSLMLIHYTISYITYYYSDASKFVKTSERQLISDGVIDEDAMQRSKLGRNDLMQAIRKQGGSESEEGIKAAYLERDGSITIIPREKEPEIVEIKVEDGVQKVVLSIS
ncbi:MAG: DUF421 domain-containing protein [Acidobacteria bacterium]|nr:MAG: DUF421 domain-containing protein [Acidobacteriota bacterium]REK02380.1 MAG: DUF421 domain-containing protein [Acidobacteriota bacterium]REK13819.1 MAG: DUF421 domain-containing protein [Acidobacteriota bacterium]REK41813.1 MAG: DUF421 domain-containing protein [Acidobacteriota bacterium]